ncbi:helix-turn-helix domain-containing protein [Erysipelothrix anatis]
MYTPVQIPTYLHDTFSEYINYYETELPSFDAWVICMWHFHQVKPIPKGHSVTNIIVADACIDCIVDQENQTIFLSGLSTMYHDVITEHPGDSFGIRMRPGAAHALFGIHATEAMDKPFDVTDRLVDSSFWNLSVQEQEGVLTTNLETLSIKITSHQALEWFEVLFNDLYLSSVDTISAHFGYSSKHMNRLFLQYYGMNVKAVVMVIRMQKALSHLINDPSEALTTLALEMGYYDQSHFINDLKLNLGMTPYAVLKRLEDVHFFQ